MNDKLLFTYYYAQIFIDCWNSKLNIDGRVTVDDLEGLLFMQLPYDRYLEWTNPFTMDNFKRDEHGYYALTLPDPKESSIW